MASFIPFADCAEVSISFAQDGIPGAITLGFRHTGGGGYDAPGLGDLATAISSSLVAGLASIQNVGIIYENIHLRSLDAVNGPVFDLPITTAGTASGIGVAAQVAMTVTFLTGISGRSFRGRNYVPGLVTTDMTDARTWSSAALALVHAKYENMDLALPSVDSEHVVLSRQNEGAPRETGVATPVIGYRANGQVYTQRRRLT